MKRFVILLALASACSNPAPPPQATESAPPVAASAPEASNSARPAPPKYERMKMGDELRLTDVSMKNVDGRMLTLNDVKGKKGTLVIFTCNHCPYAKAWEGRIAEIGNAYLEKGVGVVAINPNDPSRFPEDGFEEMKARASKLGLKFPYVVDSTSNMARAYRATKTPEAYLFDAAGKLIYHGAVDDSSEDPNAVEAPYLRDALDALLTGKAVEKPESKAIGCSIKFRPRA